MTTSSQAVISAHEHLMALMNLYPVFTTIILVIDVLILTLLLRGIYKHYYG